MYYLRLFSIILITCLTLHSCKNGTSEAKTNAETGTILGKEKPRVSVLELKTSTFYKEILSNGKLYALRKADLKFRVSEEIEKIHITNGDVVQKNMVLAIVNNFSFNNQLQRALVQYDKARTEMQDVLIGQGLNINDSARIAPQVWKIAAAKSGFTDAAINLQSAQYNFENTALRAPFSGVVANLKLKEHAMVSTAETFCTLIDNSVFNAEFQVLESEIGNVTMGEQVVLIPFSSDSVPHKGMVTEINPLIDENGLVTVKAQINNTGNKLYEGMNVRIRIRKACPGKLIVPKQAVLQRQGKQVVFTLEDGRAIWNYVTVGDENSEYYTITEGLKPGMKVIVSNNLNLGHDAEVEVSNGGE